MFASDLATEGSALRFLYILRNLVSIYIRYSHCRSSNIRANWMLLRLLWWERALRNQARAYANCDFMNTTITIASKNLFMYRLRGDLCAAITPKWFIWRYICLIRESGRAAAQAACTLRTICVRSTVVQYVVVFFFFVGKLIDSRLSSSFVLELYYTDNYVFPYFTPSWDINNDRLYHTTWTFFETHIHRVPITYTSYWLLFCVTLKKKKKRFQFFCVNKLIGAIWMVPASAWIADWLHLRCVW